MIYVGCCGIPISMEKYAELFKAVEINYTFYNLPQEKTLASWKAKLSSLIISVKAWQGVTHEAKSPTWKRFKGKLEGKKENYGSLKPTKEVRQAFNKSLEVAKRLNAKFLLLQLPFSFKDSKQNLENAKKFFKQAKRSKVRLVVELRGWKQESIDELCKKFKLIEAFDPFHKIGYVKDWAYLRLHGKIVGNKIIYRHEYSKEELKRLKEIVESLPAKHALVLFNNTNMLKDALKFQKII